MLISALEHHSNLVPWQRLCDGRGASLRVLPLSPAGRRMLQDLPAYLSPRTRIVALSQASNAIGTIRRSRRPSPSFVVSRRRPVVVIDGAQAVPHLPVDVQALDCDFYAFSGQAVRADRRRCAVGRAALLAELPPWQSGGDMVLSVTLERTQPKAPPHKFEAGTPPIAEVIGLGAAIDYFCALDRQRCSRTKLRCELTRSSDSAACLGSRFWAVRRPTVARAGGVVYRRWGPSA